MIEEIDSKFTIQSEKTLLFRNFNEAFSIQSFHLTVRIVGKRVEEQTVIDTNWFLLSNQIWWNALQVDDFERRPTSQRTKQKYPYHKEREEIPNGSYVFIYMMFSFETFQIPHLIE